MEISCSFLSMVGGVCGFDRRDRSKNTRVIPLKLCNGNIESHLSSWKFSGIKTETELLLTRAGKFKLPNNLEELTICPKHRSVLGTGWTRGGNTRCRVPKELSGHKGKLPKGDRGMNKRVSKEILKRTGRLIQVGSGMCTNCEKTFMQEDIVDLTSDFENIHVTEDDTEITFKQLDVYTPITSSSLVQQSTPLSMYKPSEETLSFTEVGSKPDTTPRDQLNSFLASRDVSPIRHTLMTSWEQISDRTKRLHIRKAKQVVNACLQEIAPEDHEYLLESISMASRDCDILDSSLLEALMECYHNADHWSSRRQILSIIADKISYKELQKWIPGITKYRYNIARHHKLLHGRGSTVPGSAKSRIHISTENLDHFLSFITSGHMVQELPFGEKTLKLSSNIDVRVPNVIRTMIPSQIVNQYESYCKETNHSSMSRSTLYRILKVCSASTRKSLQGLDNISADGAQAFDELYEVVEKLGDDCGKGLSWSKKQNEMLKNAKRYLKTDYKVHISQNSTVSDHCRVYALSDSSDKDYMSKCDHEHIDRCDRCDIIPTVINEVSKAFESLPEGIEKDQLTYQFDQAIQKIEAWKSHILRAINQDQARLDILKDLCPGYALIVLDWAMKFLPRKFRETQSDWFGKRGLSWHISVAMRKSVSGSMQMLTFVHIFEKCSQVSGTVLAIMDDVFHQLKIVAPEISTVFLRQDNAGCYHSAEVLLSVSHIARKHNITLSMDFSDPQGGKGSCDRKAATLKSKMKTHLNEGHDIETAKQMMEAIEARNGIPGVRVRLCGQQLEVGAFPGKWEGISVLNNIQFNNDGIRVWRAYGIGNGKFKLWKDFNVPAFYRPPTLNEPSDLSPHSVTAGFTDVKARRNTKKAVAAQSTDYVPESDVADDSDNETLFSCPEDGCIKSFQRYSSLQHHLDCAKHQYELERETFYDKAIVMYASKLEQGSTSEAPQISLPSEDPHNISTPAFVPLKMGWALKSTKSSKRLTADQKTYLLEFYELGELTGQKADPVSVSRAMKTARLPNGKPKFPTTYYLSPQQIAGFFSRETAKRRKAILEVQRDNLEARNEQYLQELQYEVLESISVRHPITYEAHNLCDYVLRGDLASKFYVSTLKEMCSFFELDTAATRKRKQYYVDLISGFVKQCTCSSS